MTRLQRWERASKWGLDPPEEVSWVTIYFFSFHSNTERAKSMYVVLMLFPLHRSTRS